VGDLLGEWFDTDHGWRPSTISGYRSVVRFLTTDPMARRRAVDLTPRTMAAAQTAWCTAGWKDPTVWARTRVLRSAMGWAYAERIIDLNPLVGMSPPPQARVRLHASIEDVRAFLDHAQNQVDLARRRDRGISPQTHRAEQVLLLARLAADGGARRGELAALRLGDLDGDVLTISRGVSNEVLGPTKNRGIRSMTLGATAADLWGESVERWRSQAGPPFGQAFPAAVGALWSIPARRATTVKCTRTCSNRVFIRRSHPRTVDAGTRSPAAIVRCPRPAARASRAAQITAAASARRSSTVTGSNTCVTRHEEQRARLGRSSSTPRTPRGRAHPHGASTPGHAGHDMPPATNRDSTRT